MTHLRVFVMASLIVLTCAAWIYSISVFDARVTSGESAILDPLREPDRSRVQSFYRGTVEIGKESLVWLSGLQTATLLFAAFLYRKNQK